MTAPQFYQRNQEAIQAEYKKDQERSNGDDDTRIPWLFLKPGSTILRVLPPYSDKGLFHHEIHEHAATVDGKFNPVSCGEDYGIECAFCNEGQRLYREGGESNINEAKELRPQSKFLFNVIPISTPDGQGSPKYGVKILKAGIGIKRDFLDLDQNTASGWDNITDPENGVSIIISRTGQGRTGTKYNITPHAKRSSLANVLNIQDGIGVEDLTMYNLEEVVDSPTVESLEFALKATKASSKAPVLTANPVAPTVVPVSIPARIQVGIPTPPPPTQGE